MYERGVKAYTSEEILKILPNPKIQPNRVCKTRPSSIDRSTTYVVDLNLLGHPDDMKEDEFGKWNYSGSYVLHYRAEETSQGDLELERVSIYHACR